MSLVIGVLFVTGVFANSFMAVSLAAGHPRDCCRTVAGPGSAPRGRQPWLGAFGGVHLGYSAGPGQYRRSSDCHVAVAPQLA